MRVPGYLPLAVVTGLTIGLVGCGSNGSDDYPTPTIAVSTAAARPTVAPTPVVTGDRVNSTAVGYEATIPSGWRLRPNILASTSFRGDAYFKPSPSPTPPPDTPQTNIAIGCEPITEPAEDLQSEVDTRVQVLNRLGRTNLVTADHAAVDGLESKQIDYTYVVKSDATEFAIDSREVFFLSEGCQWTVTLSAPAGELDQDIPVLEQFLASVSVNAVNALDVS